LAYLSHGTPSFTSRNTGYSAMAHKTAILRWLQ